MTDLAVAREFYCGLLGAAHLMTIETITPGAGEADLAGLALPVRGLVRALV